ncbi:MAG: hypothetical protein IJW22_08085, partial [Clostridia bacterium]|nr:hypothetical protein [Clostridia bacterium]
MENGYTMKLTSGMVKARMHDSPQIFPTWERASVLLGDRLYFSAICTLSKEVHMQARRLHVRIDSDLADHITPFVVEQVPVRHPERF